MNDKIAISNIAWESNEDDQYLSLLRKLGIKYIEIAPTKLEGFKSYEDLEFARKIRKYLKYKYDLEVVSFQAILYGIDYNIFESIEHKSIVIDHIKKVIVFAKAFGCKNLVFGSPKNRNYDELVISYKNVHKIAKSFFLELSEFADEHDVILAIEPNPKIYNNNFLCTTKETIDFVLDLGVNNIKVNLDLGAVIYNKENIEEIIKHIHLINHVHISKPYLHFIELTQQVKNIISAIFLSDYNGYYSIEMKPVDILSTEILIKDLLSLFLSLKNIEGVTL